MSAIKIGDVSFPLDSYAISGTGILGIKKSGKTWLAKTTAEQMLDMRIPIIVFDAIGVWHWLKVQRPGSGRAAYPIVVAGGKHPDLPLTPDNAQEIVRAAIRENIPLVVDLYDRHLSKADWRKIVRTCFRTLLYENEGRRHIFLEEAAEYVPQKVMDGETYAEVEKLVRMGGNAQLGITLINPRAQEVNKAVLELCENMVLMKQRGSHAIDSLEKWMDRLNPNEAKKIAASLPTLKQGECWVFAGEADTTTRTRSGQLVSLHPDRERADVVRTHTTAVTVDLVARLKKDLAVVVQEAAENDPKVLKARIAELENVYAEGAHGTSLVGREYHEAEILSAENKGFDRGYKNGYETGQNHALSGAENRLNAIIEYAAGQRTQLRQALDKIGPGAAPARDEHSAESAAPSVNTASSADNRRSIASMPATPRRAASNEPAASGSSTDGEAPGRKIVEALARYRRVDKTEQLGVISFMGVDAGYFRRGLKWAIDGCYIDCLQNGGLGITAKGDKYLTRFDIRSRPRYTVQELVNGWKEKVANEGAAPRILQFLYEHRGRAHSIDEVGAGVSLGVNAGYFRRGLKRLRTRALIEGDRQIKLSQILREASML